MRSVGSHLECFKVINSLVPSWSNLKVDWSFNERLDRSLYSSFSFYHNNWTAFWQTDRLNIVFIVDLILPIVFVNLVIQVYQLFPACIMFGFYLRIELEIWITKLFVENLCLLSGIDDFTFLTMTDWTFVDWFFGDVVGEHALFQVVLWRRHCHATFDERVRAWSWISLES